MVPARGCLPSAYLAQAATAARRPTMSSRLAVLSITCVESFNHPTVHGLTNRYCVLYQMLSGRALFESFVPLQAALRIASGERPARPPPHAAAAIQNVQDALWAIAEDCWRQEVIERPTIAAVHVRLECTCTQAPSLGATLLETRCSSVSTTTPPNAAPVSKTAAEAPLSPPIAQSWPTVKPARPTLAPTAVKHARPTLALTAVKPAGPTLALTATPLILNVSSGTAAASAPESATPQLPMPFLVDDRNSRSISASAVPDSTPRFMPGVAMPGVTGETTIYAPVLARYHARRASKW
jgi:hypothetical protein